MLFSSLLQPKSNHFFEQLRYLRIKCSLWLLQGLLNLKEGLLAFT
jgi:hypothetical protein